MVVYCIVYLYLFRGLFIVGWGYIRSPLNASPNWQNGKRIRKCIRRCGPEAEVFLALKILVMGICVTALNRIGSDW